MSETHTSDVVVLGMGPAGESVAGQLAQAGLSVVGIDANLVGGECPYWGCIPSKMMVHAADLLAEGRRIPEMAGQIGNITPDWGMVARRIRDEATDNWDDTVAVERFEGHGGTFVRGRGRLIADDAVEVEGTVYRATTALVVATGSAPFIPPISGLDDTPFWTNRAAVEAVDLPGSITVIGGGAIGLELAQAYGRFGSDVTVVEAADHLLPHEEPEVGEMIADVLAAEHIDLHVGASAVAVDHDGAKFTTTLADGSTVTSEQLLVAAGRRVDLGSIGADAIGVDVSEPGLPTDEHLRVAPGVWAVGDVTFKGLFTHVGMYQAAIVVADILDQAHETADYSAVPRVTFTDPEVGSVGMTEAQAIDAGLSVAVTSKPVAHTARGWLHQAGNDGLIKLVIDTDRDVLVGATAAGPDGGEVLGFLSLAVHAAIPLPTLRTMIYAYPTFHRGIEDALNDL